MRFDRATIALQPMTMSNCVDLALRFLRVHFQPIAQGWLSICGPTCVIAYVLIDRARGNLVWGLVALAIGSALFSAYLIAGTGSAAFGDPFTFRSAWERILFKRGRLIRQALGLRFLDLLFPTLAALLFASFSASEVLRFLQVLVYGLSLVPSVWLTVRYGFTLEQAVLGRNEKNSSDRQVSEIVKHSLVDLIFRWVGIGIFSGLLWLSLTVGIDQTITVLFQRPLLFGRIETNAGYHDSPAEILNYLLSFYWEDPGIIVYLLAMTLAAYPLGRLAWFFCYIDLRVRQDCWDIELQIQQEAERLEGRTTT